MKNEKGTILITGGAKRIGKSIALFLAKSGYDIVIQYNSSQKEASALTKEIKNLGVNIYKFHIDFQQFAQYHDLINKIQTCIESPLVGIINNAAIFKEIKFLDTNEELFNQHIMINFKAPFFLTQQFAQYIIQNHSYQLTPGKYFIINIIDSNIRRKNSKFFIYNITKKSLDNFTIASAKELADIVRINSISPGIILTDKYQSKEFIEQYKQKVANQKMTNLQDINQMIEMIIHNKSLYAQNIFLDKTYSII